MSQPGLRKEVGGAESSRLHPPHTDVNALGAPVQDETQAPNDVPTLSANAHGSDKGAGEDAPGHIDPESAYDRRPGEDKDREETEMP